MRCPEGMSHANPEWSKFVYCRPSANGQIIYLSLEVEEKDLRNSFGMLMSFLMVNVWGHYSLFPFLCYELTLTYVRNQV